MSEIEKNTAKSKPKPNPFQKISKNSKFLKSIMSPKATGGLSLTQKISALEEEVNLLTSYSTDTIYRLDYRTMKYDYISPAIKKLLGFTAAEMKKINFRSLIVETKIIADGINTISSFSELEQKRKAGDVGIWQADYLIRTKSTNKIWVSDVSHPWFDSKGNVIGAVGSLRDITDRINAETSAKKTIRTTKETFAEAQAENQISFQ